MGINNVPVTQGTLIYRFFVKDRFDSDNMLIVYHSTEHMLEDLFMKYLQGYILVKFHLNHGVKARINIIDGTALNQGASWKCGKG